MSEKQHYYSQLARSVIDTANEPRPLWDWISKHIMPRMTDAVQQCTPNPNRKRSIVACAARSLAILASAHYSYITPGGTPWCDFHAPDEATKERDARWYSAVSEAILKELSLSNFYTEIQEVYRSRSGLGTALMLCEPKSSGKGVIFKHIPVGTFGIAEDKDGIVSTVCRQFEYTAAQAVERFGYNSVPHDVQTAYNEPTRRYSDKFKFLHLVTPRKEYTSGNFTATARNAKYASVYLFDGGDFPIVEEGGYAEFPYLCTRYLKWDGTVWGFPPVVQVMDSLQSLCKMDNNMDMLSDLAAFPRIMQLAEQSGEIDFRAGGVTTVTPQAASAGLPREWGTSGRYDIGKDRMEDKKKDIEFAFNVPFVQVISNSEPGKMTATEVHARQSEQIVTISPTFTLFSYDNQPFMYRIYCVLFRQGRFDNLNGVTTPDNLKIDNKDATGENVSIRVPDVQLQGRITKDLKQAQSQSLEGLVSLLTNYVQATGDTSLFDHIDTGLLFRKIYESSGAPVDVLRSKSDVSKLRKAREEQQLAAQQAAIAQQQGAAALSFSKAATAQQQ